MFVYRGVTPLCISVRAKCYFHFLPVKLPDGAGNEAEFIAGCESNDSAWECAVLACGSELKISLSESLLPVLAMKSTITYRDKHEFYIMW